MHVDAYWHEHTKHFKNAGVNAAATGTDGLYCMVRR